MPIKVYVYAAIAALLFGGGWYTGKQFNDAKLYAQAQKAEKDRKELADKNAALIEEVSKNEQNTRIEYRDRWRTVYRDVPATECLDPVGLRNANEAIRSANGSPDAVPTAAGIHDR